MRAPFEGQFSVTEDRDGTIHVAMTRGFADDLAGALGEDRRWEEVNAVRLALLAALGEPEAEKVGS